MAPHAFLPIAMSLYTLQQSEHSTHQLRTYHPSRGRDERRQRNRRLLRPDEIQTLTSFHAHDPKSDQQQKSVCLRIFGEDTPNGQYVQKDRAMQQAITLHRSPSSAFDIRAFRTILTETTSYQYLIQRGGGTGPLNPRQPVSFSRKEESHQVPIPAGRAEVSVALI